MALFKQNNEETCYPNTISIYHQHFVIEKTKDGPSIH